MGILPVNKSEQMIRSVFLLLLSLFSCGDNSDNGELAFKSNLPADRQLKSLTDSERGQICFSVLDYNQSHLYFSESICSWASLAELKDPDANITCQSQYNSCIKNPSAYRDNFSTSSNLAYCPSDFLGAVCSGTISDLNNCLSEMYSRINEGFKTFDCNGESSDAIGDNYSRLTFINPESIVSCQKLVSNCSIN